MNGSFIRGALCALGVSVPVSASAQEREIVGVEVSLDATRFARTYDGQTRREISTRGAEIFASVLGERFPFLAFVPQVSAEYTIIFHFDRINSSERDLGIFVELRAMQGATKTIRWHTYREELEALDALGSQDVFLKELELKLRASAAPGTAPNYTLLLDSLITRVPIARTGAAWHDPVGWIIPYEMRELCIEGGSTLRFTVIVPTGVGPTSLDYIAVVFAPFNTQSNVPPHVVEYLQHIFSKAIEGQRNMDELRSGIQQMQTDLRAVYVVNFVPRGADCVTAAPTSTVSFWPGNL